MTIESQEIEQSDSIANYDLNAMRYETWMQLGIVSANDARLLMDHSKNYGRWRCVEELQTCTFLRAGLCDSLRAICYVQDLYFSSAKPTTRCRLILSNRLALSDTNTRNILQYCVASRMQGKIQLGNLHSVSFAIERDASEPLLYKRSVHPLDYSVATFAGQNKSASFKYFVGDYEVMFGYGLGFYQGFLVSARSNWTGIQASSTMFKAHQGMRENAYCEGTAVEWSLKHLAIGAFVSYRLLDNSKIGNQISVSQAFHSSGMHQSVASIAGRQTVPLGQSGLQIKYTKNNYAIGLYSTAHTLLIHQLIGNAKCYTIDSRHPYIQSGVWANYSHPWAYCQFEFLCDNFNNRSLQAQVVKPFFAGDLYAYYIDKSHCNFDWLANANSIQTNSRAWSLNWQSPMLLHNCKTFIGYYHSTSLMLLEDKSATQDFIHLRFEYALSKKQQVYFILQNKLESGDWQSVGEYFPKRVDLEKRIIAFGGRSEITGQENFRFLMQVSISDAAKLNGALANCQQKFKVPRIAGTWTTECTAFQINDYQNRMYLLRQDWPGSMINSAYYGDGVQTQVAYKCLIHKWINLQLYLGRKWQFDQKGRSLTYCMISLQMHY